MAITIRLQYLEHLIRALKHVGARNPDAIIALLPGLVDYIANGSYETLANRRDLVRIVVNVIWKQMLDQQYDGHQMRHLLLDQGIVYASTEDVPNVEEPAV